MLTELHGECHRRLMKHRAIRARWKSDLRICARAGATVLECARCDRDRLGAPAIILVRANKRSRTQRKRLGAYRAEFRCALAAITYAPEASQRAHRRSLSITFTSVQANDDF
jgi:hypothetical protein